ncbi:related to folC [Phialocephala subalpina]|uniref:Folylpolyglutamate synthase n=1 Tax=Phialocephala subalpina TaxID=576137 RepID=A0A1L7WTF3_9HELO|nr:related to folC [Phialocephala subalpina]
MNLDATPEMQAWTRKAGYDVQDFAKHGLKCIHVAGTKGKGSVCAMTESILLQYRVRVGVGESLGKIGLYTSPHLVHIRERIRIDGSPISEPVFAKYFFELWDRFSNAAALESDIDIDPLSPDTKPAYFRYLTLLAFHTFIRERVETVIVECGIGGEYDSTNILPAAVVTTTGITTLGIDHAGMLGETIEDIAWHKAGIMKTDIPAFTTRQSPEALAVLNTRAVEKGAYLCVVDRLPVLDDEIIKLGLDGDFQRDNASLAIVLAAAHLRTMGVSDGVTDLGALATSFEGLPEEFITGLETATWPGRCQFIKDGNTEWFIDGAHTKDSLVAAAAWYTSKLYDAMRSDQPPTATMLIFNQQDRDSQTLLRGLLTSLFNERIAPRRVRMLGNYISPRTGMERQWPHLRVIQLFTYAAFCTNQPFKSAVEGSVDTKAQTALANLYSSIDENQLHMVYESVEEAVDLAHKISEGDERVLVFVTGSLYLVGSVLKVLEKKGIDTTMRYQSSA